MRPLFRDGEVRLGLGLIGIGRPWGQVAHDVPTDREVRQLLEYAFTAGIRHFDTAPSYGLSEQRLGAFLRSLMRADRAAVTVATKFGEHWDFDRNQSFTDHSYSALARSLGQSLQHLESIDVLQLHKTTPATLASDDVAHAWDLARGAGISDIGPSISDPESARIACDQGRFQMIQMPLNLHNERFASCAAHADRAGLWVAGNRPFAMGALAVNRAGAFLADAFRFVLANLRRGIVLTGTTSPLHLAENVAAFRAAQSLGAAS